MKVLTCCRRRGSRRRIQIPLALFRVALATTLAFGTGAVWPGAHGAADAAPTDAAPAIPVTVPTEAAAPGNRVPSAGTAAPGESSAPPTWFTLTSPHFYVHYPSGWEGVARDVVGIAEQAHRDLVPILRYEPDERTHIAITDVSDVANGSTDVYYYNRVVIYPVSPEGPGYGSGFAPGTANWLRLLIIHEYTHVLHLDMHGGAVRAMKRLLGRVPLLSTPNMLQPTAFVEGYATHLESVLVPSGRTNGALYDMFLRAAALDGTLLDGDKALGRYDLDEWVPASAPYLYGSAFMDYLADRFGEERLADVHWAFAELNTVSVDAALRRELGSGFAELWRDWKRKTTDRYETQAESIRSEGLTEVEPWPSSPAHIVTDPAYSPDGKWVAYASSDGTFPDVRIRSAASAGSEAGGAAAAAKAAPARDRQVAKGMATELPGLSWFPDGRRLVYSRLEYVDASRLYSDLYVVDVDKGASERLTNGMRAFAPAVSPDGERVAFVARSGPNVRIVEMEVESRAVTTLYEPVGDEFPYGLAWSPSGDRLAVSMKADGERGTRIAVLSVDGRSDQPAIEWVTGAPGVVDENPAWTLDGEMVVFDSNRGGVYNLYAVDVGTGRLFRLTNVLTGAFDPAVSPDGEQVTFLYFTADGYRLASLPWADLRWESVEPGYGAVQPGYGDEPGYGADGTGYGADGTGYGADGTGYGADGTGAPVKTDDVTGVTTRTAAVAALDVAAEKRPYNPLLSLRPRYWIPLSKTEDGPQIGLTTGGMDALGRHAFEATLYVGTSSGRTEGDVQYSHVLDDRSGWTLGAGATWNARAYARVGDGSPAGTSTEKVRLDQGTLTLAQTSPRYFGGRRLALTVGVDRLTVLDGSEPTGNTEWAPRLGSSLTWQGVTGDGERMRSRTVVLGTGLSWPEDELPGPAARVTTDWVDTYAFGDTSSVDFASRLGYSNGAGTFTVGGVWDGADITVRGLERRDDLVGEPFAGQSAVGSSIEWERRLVSIESGSSGVPIFFDSLNGALFVDAVGVQDVGDPWRLAAGAGAELRLDTDLDYGRYAITWTLGVAHAWHDGSRHLPQVYFTFTAGL